jgi:PIN like domain
MRPSSTSGPQPEPVFFTDRDLGRSVAAALRAGGLQVQAYHEHFTPDNVPDREWLRYIGERGWIALSHNKYIRYERDELDDLMKFGVKAFFIIGKGPHSAFAAVVLRNIDKIYELIRDNSEPFVAKVYQHGDVVEEWITHAQWLEARRRAKPK